MEPAVEVVDGDQLITRWRHIDYCSGNAWALDWFGDIYNYRLEWAFGLMQCKCMVGQKVGFLQSNSLLSIVKVYSVF